MIRKTIYTYFLSGLCMTALHSCSLNIPPPDQFSDPDAITNVSSARSLLTSCYLLYPHYEYDLSVLGADFCPTNLSGKDVDEQNLYKWQDKSISDFSDDVWLAYYNTIANCDVLLERMDNVVTETTDEQKEKAAIIAEARTLEAMSYFNLLRLFAPAYNRNPDADGVVLKTRVGLESPKRSSIKDCTEHIRQLLLEAVKVNHAPVRNGWLSQTAGYYLLAEVELYAGNYAKAAEYAETVLQKADDSYFTKGNYERLWQKDSYAGRIFAFYTANTYYVNIQFDADQGDLFAVNPAITFADTDIRKEYSLYPKEMDGGMRTLFGKYNRNNKVETATNYVDMMRYAGAYFIAAEAYSRLDGQEARARTLLNHYLTLCGAETIPENLSGTALTNLILQKKQVEFLGEGQSYFDWKRTHRQSLPRLTTWGKGTSAIISPDDYRWTFPIPASEYKYNDNMTQNEGWPINRNK